ncbi:MAG: hypothetical protein IJ714_03200 [Bacteroidales bacterium]|nr:hypothetical protein [Bacteroidales bacterium]MBR1698776.1 hypothetical protein [Bacteroidales bacterium]MBR6861639.1 hypothetical protein [Acidaminococcaceae bacterium]
MNIEKYLRDPEVSKVDYPCQGIYFIRYEDGSVSVVDENDKRINTPLRNFDVVQQLRFIGRLHGVPHFAYKACEYGNRFHPEYGMFDINGHEKMFRDPRLCGLESVTEIEAEFKKLVDASNDLSNPRRNDEMLVDLSTGKSLEMER